MNETGLYEIESDLAAARGSVAVRTCIADVADPRRMRELFLRERPEVVFHAAAYKHVPLVEANPDQGFITNVLGTLAVCESAVAAGAERVVVISTDKAVNPSSFMGLTKRVAELMVVAVSQTRRGLAPMLSAVRFGNVLGSRGSLVPTLLRQIEAGGPITITHPDAQRFFMTIAEAASLVLLSAAFGTSGGLFVLDMGDEVRVEQLAERLVRLRGLRLGRDVSGRVHRPAPRRKVARRAARGRRATAGNRTYRSLERRAPIRRRRRSTVDRSPGDRYPPPCRRALANRLPGVAARTDRQRRPARRRARRSALREIACAYALRMRCRSPNSCHR